MKWLEANGVALRYDLRGEGGPTLVLIHEMGGGLETWDDTIPALTRKHRILRFDVRGMGLSEAYAGPLTIDAMADDIAALLGRLKIAERVVIVGCAVGAAAAIHFTARYPDRVAGLIAMSPATYAPPHIREMLLSRADLLEREGLRAALPPAAEGASLDDPAERLRCRRLGNKPAGVAKMSRMLADLDIEADYGRIRCPALVLAGQRDPFRPPTLVEPIARKIPHAEYRVLDTGHVMPVDTPDIISETILNFARGVGH